MTVQPSQGGAVERPQESSLSDVVTTILDKGVVVDVFARVSLVGIELLRVDARVVIASVDTYLRFAEATERLDMGAEEPSDLTEVVGQTASLVSGGGEGQGDEGQAELEAGGQEVPAQEQEEKEEVEAEREREESRS